MVAGVRRGGNEMSRASGEIATSTAAQSGTGGVITGYERRATIDAAGVALMLFICISWGMNQVAIKIGNQGFNPMYMAAARALTGGILVFLWCRLRGIALFEKDRTLIPGLVIGLLFGLEFVLIFAGLDFTSAGRSTLMMNTMPFWVAIGAHFLLGERMRVLTVAGMIVAFCGVVLVLSDELSMPGEYAIYGDILCLVSSVFWAATTLVIKKTTLSDAAPEKTLLYQLLVAAIVPLPFAPVLGDAVRDPTMITYAAFIFQAAFIVAFTYPLWFWMIRRYPASALSNFALLIPAFGVMLSGLVLGEPMSWKLFAALGLIAGGLFIANYAQRVAVQKATLQFDEHHAERR